MKNKILKVLILISLFLIPFVNVSAVTLDKSNNEWLYKYVRMPVNNLINNYSDLAKNHLCSKDSGTPGICLPIIKNTCESNSNYVGCMFMRSVSKEGSNSAYNAKTYNLTIHEVNDGDGTYYQGYCLHVGKDVKDSYIVQLQDDWKNLPDIKNRTKADEDYFMKDQKVLKNIVASGYQNGKRMVKNLVYKNNDKGENVSAYGDTGGGKCTDTASCKKLLVTQMLIWEITAGVRTGYAHVPETYGHYDNNKYVANKYSLEEYRSTAYYNIIHSNDDLKTIYYSILDEAKDLSTKEIKPEYNEKTYILHWKDSKNKYVSDQINIGKYKVTTENTDTLKISSKDSDNNIVVSSTKKVSKEKAINTIFIKGSTNKNSTNFRWYRFYKDKDGNRIPNENYQDVLMGDYSRSFDAYFNVKTESGKFTLYKVEKDTGNILPGSKFTIAKCIGGNCSNIESAKAIDATSGSAEVTIDKSGKYLFTETQVPFGRQGLGQFTVTFDIDANGIAKIVETNNSNYVYQLKQNGVIVEGGLVIGNDSKDFVVSKIDGNTGAPIGNVTFQILDSNNNPVKFEIQNGKYRYSTSGTITDLVTAANGQFIVQLLPQGNYTILETMVPYPYSLSGSLEDRKTYIRIDSNSDLWTKNSANDSYIRSTNAIVTIKNFKTIAEVIKTGEKGTALKSVMFELYDSSKQNQIRLVQSSESVYDYSPDQSISPIQMITNDVGKITINYLPAGKYWVKETVSADGYVIDQTVEWTELEVVVNKNNSPRVTKTIRNAKGTFNFYKIDEDGNYLSAGKFKLQVYNNKTEKFEDATLIYNKEENTYTVDKTGKSDIIVFTPINGIVTFVDVEAKSRYRVVEIEAPEGFILPKVSETEAEIVVNENGYALGDSVIINKKVTLGEEAQASAELIISVSTGQNRIRYILIIGTLLIIIIGLFMINRKMRKK